MEIISPPATETIRVTDLDVQFQGGAQSLTLFPGDALEFTDSEIRIRIAKSGEELVIDRRHVLWYSRRERDLVRPLKPTPGVPALNPATKEPSDVRPDQPHRT